MKLGILTFTRGQNIGQRLQNYALQEVLRRRGHEVYTICQYKPSVKKLYNKFWNTKTDNAMLSLRKQESEETFRLFDEKYITYYEKELSFYQNWMPLKGFPIPYKGNGKLIDRAFDGFIVGSDQVWNPMSPDVGENYFLRFTERSKRFNYAPSISCEEIPIRKIAKYKKWIKGFQYLTVREQQGADIIYKLTGKDAQVVLDPTMLLTREDWNGIKKIFIGKPENRNYILSLFLGKIPHEYVDEIKKITGYILFQIESPIRIAPDEFLDVLEHAAIVLTDSYHVTVFSVIYHVPFVNFTRYGGESMNSRFDTLYNMIGIQDRRWTNFLEKEREQLLTMPFEKMERNLEAERERSLRTLAKQGL